MVNRLKLALDQAEYSALLKVATSELRSPDDQARYIVRQELTRRNLLPLEPPIEYTEVRHEPQQRAA